MEMHQVRYFLAVARTLNFTRAAEECHVSQPSLTRAVQKLEEEFGGALLHRERANTHLTDLGRRMLPHLERAYSAAEAAKALAVGVKRGEISPLGIGVMSTVSIRVLMDLLANLKQGFAGLELTIGGGTQAQVIEEALEGTYDLVLVGEPTEASDRLRSWTLYREPCHLVMPAGHALAALESVPVSALSGMELITRAGCPIAPRFLALAEQSGLRISGRHSASSEDHLQHLVLCGFGLAISPASVPLAQGLISRPVEGEAPEHTVALAVVAGRRFSPAAELFIRLARARRWTEAALAPAEG